MISSYIKNYVHWLGIIIFIRNFRSGSEGGLANAFLVPQWGGVVLYNDYTNSSNSMEVMMEEIMVTFVNQLKLLFGLEENKVIEF